MDNDFLGRIILERDYKISILREKLESGDLDQDILFRYLNEISRLQYRFFGHFDIINLKLESTMQEKTKAVGQSLSVLEKTISFTDGIIAALSSGSMYRHLLTPYHGRNDTVSIREKILMSGQTEIFESYGFQPLDP